MTRDELNSLVDELQAEENRLRELASERKLSVYSLREHLKTDPAFFERYDDEITAIINQLAVHRRLPPLSDELLCELIRRIQVALNGLDFLNANELREDLEIHRSKLLSEIPGASKRLQDLKTTQGEVCSLLEKVDRAGVLEFLFVYVYRERE